jgi:hypothetical protein
MRIADAGSGPSARAFADGIWPGASIAAPSARPAGREVWAVPRKIGGSKPQPAFISRSLRRHNSDTGLTYLDRVAPEAPAGHLNGEDG